MRVKLGLMGIIGVTEPMFRDIGGPHRTNREPTILAILEILIRTLVSLHLKAILLQSYTQQIQTRIIRISCPIAGH